MSYEVYSLREGHWNLDSVYDDRGLALHEARHLLKRRYEKGVKVVKENYDDETNKSIPTTIFHEREGVKKTLAAAAGEMEATRAHQDRRSPQKVFSRGFPVQPDFVRFRTSNPRGCMSASGY